MDKNSSLAVYSEHLHCFGCGFHLDSWRSATLPEPDNYKAPLAMLLGVTNEEAKAVESRYNSDTLDAYRERAATEARMDPMPNVLADIYSQMLLEGPRQHRLEWLYERGLHLETIARSKIGHDGNRFVIPIFSEGGDLISLRFRRDDAYMEDPTPKYCGVKGRNGLYVYGEDWIDIDDRALVICEGELDVVRLRQEGITAVTATNGAGQTHKLPKIIAERWPHITTLYIATDMDEPGEEAARQTLKACAGLSQFWARRLTWPEGKDVTDAYTHGCFPAVG